MRIPHYWPLLVMQVPLAFATCHYAMGYGPWVSAFLTLLTLHPLTWTIPVLLAIHAVVNVPSAADAAAILLPLATLGVLSWLVRVPNPRAVTPVGRRTSPAIT